MQQGWLLLIGAMIGGGALTYALAVKFLVAKKVTGRGDDEIFAIPGRPSIRIEYDLMDEANSKFLCDMRILLDDLLAGTYVVPSKQDTQDITTAEPDFIPEDDSDGPQDEAEEKKGDFVSFDEINKSVI